jgi:hypothetical protein
LYPASASSQLPNRAYRSPRYRAAAAELFSRSRRSSTQKLTSRPYPRPMPARNCQKPPAPLLDRALEVNPLSIIATNTSPVGRPSRASAASMVAR